MFLLLLLLFPVLEIYIFIQAIDEFGFFAVLAEVILTAWLGFTILKFRSWIVMGAIQKTLNRQARPEAEMIKSLLIFLGAIFLIVPGIITDIIGLLCLFGPTRQMIGMIMSKRLSGMAKSGKFQTVYNPGGPFGFPGQKPADFGKGEIRDVNASESRETSAEVIYLRKPSDDKSDA